MRGININMRNYLQENNTMFAFNIWDLNSAQSVIDAAAVEHQNIILQTSAGLYSKLPHKQLREFVSSYQKEKSIKVWLHLDHCKSEDMIMDAIKNGWDSVMIDASAKPVDENIEITNRITKYAHENNILVEAEVGQVIGVEDDICVMEAAVASRLDVKRFIENTNVDMLAVAFGNAHGVYKGEPELHYDLVEYTTSISDTPFVVHGGSGLSTEVLERLIKIPNVKKINISTEVKIAYRDGIVSAYQQGFMNENGFQAIKVNNFIDESIQRLVIDKLKLLR